MTSSITNDPDDPATNNHRDQQVHSVSAARRIRFLDLILFIYGVQLFSGPGIPKAFNFGLRLTCASVFYLNLITFIVITDHREDIFLSLAYIFKYLIFIALHHYFSLRTSQLKQIFVDHDQLVQSFRVFSPLKIGSLGALKTWTVITLGALATTARVVSFDYKAYSKYERRGQKENLVNAILTTLLVNVVLVIYNFGWLFATLVFYAYCQLLAREINDNFFSLARRPFAPPDLEPESAGDKETPPQTSGGIFTLTMNGSSAVHAIADQPEDFDKRSVLIQLRGKRKRMQAWKHQLNVSIGLLPFLWFVMVYFEVSWLLIATSGSSLIHNLSDIIYRMFISLYVCVICLGTEMVHRREQRQTDQLLGWLKVDGDDQADVIEEKIGMVRDINESPVIAPKILMVMPVGKYSLMILFAITVPSALAIRLFA